VIEKASRLAREGSLGIPSFHKSSKIYRTSSGEHRGRVASKRKASAIARKKLVGGIVLNHRDGKEDSLKRDVQTARNQKICCGAHTVTLEMSSSLLNRP
jgi:hypothetical protein